MDSNLRTLTPESADFNHHWNSFVLTHELAWAGHLPAQFALADAAGVRNRSLILLDPNDKPIGAIPLFEQTGRYLRLFNRRTLASGFELPAQPLLSAIPGSRHEAEILTAIYPAIESVAASCGADDIVVGYPMVVGGEPAVERYRYFPLRDNGFIEENVVGLLIKLDRDLDTIMKGLESSCRNKIRRAQKEGCTVRPVRDVTEWMQCRDLAQQTLGAFAPSEQLHRAYWDHYIAPGHAFAQVVSAPGQDTPANVLVAVGWAGSWYYWKSYNSRTKTVPGINNLGVWSAIAAVKERGGAYFELGSLEFADPKQKAIGDFKRSFGGVPTYGLHGIRHRRPIRRAAFSLLAEAYHTYKGGRE